MSENKEETKAVEKEIPNWAYWALTVGFLGSFILIMLVLFDIDIPDNYLLTLFAATVLGILGYALGRSWRAFFTTAAAIFLSLRYLNWYGFPKLPF